MLTYSFSRREKTLILVLVIVLLVVVWYMFVFKGTTEQLDSIRSEISQVDEESAIASAKVSQMDYMQKVIDEKKAAGVKPTPLPEYDNMQKLMSRLDTVMSAATTYTLSFGELGLSSSGYVMRPVSVAFQCTSYGTADAIVQNLASGPFPCVITSVSIIDNSANGRSSSDGTCSGSVQVTFFEKNDGSFAAPPTEEELAAMEAAAAS